MIDAPTRARRLWPWLVLGLALGIGAVALLGRVRGAGFQEREEFFPRAEPAVIADWTEQWQTRAGPWREVPDPPGTGPVVKARYWLSRAVYDMEVRRRGNRFVVEIGGIDTQFAGGGWTAFGEGHVTGDAHSFRGAVATITWSCLSARYRHMSDGVGRIWFSEDGSQVHAVYVAYEAPALWAKAYGRLQVAGEARPPYASFRGQIPYEPAMERLPDGKQVTRRVRVVDEAGRPLTDALVRLKGVAGVSARTDPEGRATLRFEGRQAPYAQVIAAGRPGYRNAETVLLAGDDEDAEAEIALAALDLTDHAAYPWNEPAPSTDPDDLMACGTCHEWTYAEWFTSRHARAADNGHVTWERERMRKGDPEAPDDCTGCHQPAYAVQDPGGPWSPRGVSAGNHCDFCHKIQDVLDVMESGALGAYHVVRPDPQGKDRPGGIHHVFGPLADSTFAYMGASYAPVYQESRFCAGCHQGGGRWRTGSPPKVNTYEEWRAWVADKEGEEAKQCQDCHMPGASTVAKSGAVIDQVAWDGLHRSADDVHTHRWDATNPQFASRGFELHADKQRDEKTGEWIVTVSMTNSGAGHSIPTGTWSKQVVVGIWAAGAAGPLKQLAGPRAMTDVRAKPGAALEAGDWTNPAGFVLGVSVVGEGSGRPTPPFWHAWPAAQIDDQRLAPGTTREVTCRFEATPDGTAPVVEVRVIHRRAWLPRGAAGVPWTVRTYDAPPEVLWRRLIR